MMTLNKILYPTDFSPAAEQAFDTAQRLARDSRSVLLIVHVTAPTQVPTPPGAVVPPHAMANVALPEDAEQAMEQADLIVMGTHGRTGLTRLLMGSVAEAVVRRAPCPVLTLRQSPADGDDQPGDSATG